MRETRSAHLVYVFDDMKVYSFSVYQLVLMLFKFNQLHRLSQSPTSIEHLTFNLSLRSPLLFIARGGHHLSSSLKFRLDARLN